MVGQYDRIELELGLPASEEYRAAIARLDGVVEVQSEQRVIGIRVEEPDLESVFLSLTGRALRD
ncbi:MAG: hypothetical protein ACOC2Q_01770 [Spirochaetota bacterium]